MGRQAAWLIIVTGLPAAGKSCVAEALVAALGCPLLAKDALKEPLLDQFPEADAATSRALSDASFALLFALAPALLAQGTGLVLEGNFRPGEHEAPLHGLTLGVGRVVQLLCRVDEPLRRERLAARAADPGRHPGHRDARQASGAVDTRADAFLDLPGERWEMRGDASAAEWAGMITRLLAILPAWQRPPSILKH